MIVIKRIYDKPNSNDGYRILVDRLWPRGVKKEYAMLNEWNKTIAPSTELRKWFAHKSENFKQFSELYTVELNEQKEELSRIKNISKSENLTLLYAAKNPLINHALVLLNVLKSIH
ncbi:MAG: DUF488 family protein [Flavobacteriales bacterium]|nr:DUF488 family protein [Flavobacteriales bacterium]